MSIWKSWPLWDVCLSLARPETYFLEHHRCVIFGQCTTNCEQTCQICARTVLWADMRKMVPGADTSTSADAIRPSARQSSVDTTSLDVVISCAYRVMGIDGMNFGRDLKGTVEELTWTSAWEDQHWREDCRDVKWRSIRCTSTGVTYTITSTHKSTVVMSISIV